MLTIIVNYLRLVSADSDQSTVHGHTQNVLIMTSLLNLINS